MTSRESSEALCRVSKPEIDIGQAFDLITHRFYLSVLTFDCIITNYSGKVDPQGFPFFLGPTLRGAFGYALKECCCGHPDPVWREKLKECPQECDCAYKTIFLSPAPPGLHPPYRGRTFKPHPFSLRAPWLKTVHVGLRFSFEVTIIGEAHRAVEGFIEAFLLAGRKGLNHHHWSFSYAIDTVRQLHPDGNAVTIWKAGKGFSGPTGEVNILSDFMDEKTVAIFKEGVDVHLISPLDMVIERRTIENLETLSEIALASRLAGALEEMGVFWCGMDTLGAKPRLADPVNLPIEKLNEKIYERTRVSVQEGNAMPLCGLLGTFRIRKPHPDTVRLLAALMHIGIGQNRTFGFGRYDLYPTC